MHILVNYLLIAIIILMLQSSYIRYQYNIPVEETKLTVIIPATGRTTLVRSLRSLQNQDNPDWKALVGFDGISFSNLVYDSRISYHSFPKIGGGINNGGKVRNALMEIAETEWVAFLDDDDTFRYHYVNAFLDELRENPEADCIIFRMSYDSEDRKTLPPAGLKRPTVNLVGISFAVRLNFLKQKDVSFTNSDIEDFILLDQIYKQEGHIVFSNYIGYNVRF